MDKARRVEIDRLLKLHLELVWYILSFMIFLLSGLGSFFAFEAAEGSRHKFLLSNKQPQSNCRRKM